MSDYQLSTLLQSHTPMAVWTEIRLLLEMACPNLSYGRVHNAYWNTIRLYNGRYPNYRSCNTHYHDFSHVAATCLALIRLIHGAKIAGHEFDPQEVTTSLVAALLHDVGFIQEIDDLEGTGAKYTVVHVARSQEFLTRHAEEYQLSAEEVENACVMIAYTDLSTPMEEIEARTEDIAELGGLLGAADLMAQMADRYYLEKLFYLYDEFKEAEVGNYANPIEMLHQTVDFFAVVENRLSSTRETINSYFSNHFRVRWGIDADLYEETLKRQSTYLENILALPDSDPSQYLRRHLY